MASRLQKKIRADLFQLDFVQRFKDGARISAKVASIEGTSNAFRSSNRLSKNRQ